MRVWDARDGHLIHKVFGGHAGPVAAVAFSPDGRTIASASYRPHGQALELRRPEASRSPSSRGHTDEVRAVAFSPDGRRIASAGLDRTIRVWDAQSGAELAVIWGHTGAVLSLAYGPDSAQGRHGLRRRDGARLGHRLGPGASHASRGTPTRSRAVAVSPDGRDIASASADATVRVWDAASPPRPRTLQSPSLLTYGGAVECVAFSPDGRRLVSGHDDHALRVWELPSGRLLHVIKGHTRRITCVAFSPDGRTIASGSDGPHGAAVGRRHRPAPDHLHRTHRRDRRAGLHARRQDRPLGRPSTARSRPGTRRPGSSGTSCEATPRPFTTWRSAPTAAPSLRPATTRRASSGTSPTGGLA